MMTMPQDVAPFVNSGFSIHLLHSRTKRPIGTEWSTQPTVSMEELLASYRDGNNVGVRLGEPSLLTNGLYLHAFDIDIRVPELADEAWAALRALLPGVNVDTLPCVASGSGGESRHLYFGTSRAFRGKVLATSEGKYRGADGKWHYDWEVELFGTGKQVVLPPSIHPDTGKPYAWLREFDLEMLDFGVCPEISADLIESLGAVDPEKFAFEDRPPLDFKPGQMDRELGLIEVSDLHYDDWIRLGQALHHQFGGSQEGFDLWLTHTQRSTKFTGDAQIREMRRSKWRSFGKYRGQPVTMATVRQWAKDAATSEWVDELDDLDDEPAAEVPSEPKEPADVSDAIEDAIASLMKETPGDDRPWQSLLDIDSEKGAIRATLHNVELIVKHDDRLVGLPQLNEFTQETVQRTLPGIKRKSRANAAKETRQLSGRVWEVRDVLNGEIWSSSRDYAIRSILEAPKTQGGYGMKITDRDLKAATVLSAWANSFHPVQEYLRELKWDGTPRMERLFIDYLGCADSPYTRNVARLMLLAAVSRVFEPGCKWDHAVILEGLQGAGKSTFIRTLGRRWFSELEGDFHDGKEMVEKIQGSWIVEIPELSGFNRSDVQSIKAFISRQTDKVRLAYEARAMEFPRQCILIGSTNDKEYLRDSTGGRRFFPMECHVENIDNAALRQNVDQLWAEAHAVYVQMRKECPVEMGDLPLYLENAHAAEEAARLQESRRVESADDALAGQIAAWLQAPALSGSLEDDPTFRTETCLVELWVECMGNERKNYGNAASQILGRAMRLVPGWSSSSSKTRFVKYGQQRVWTKGNDAERSSRMGLLKFN